MVFAERQSCQADRFLTRIKISEYLQDDRFLVLPKAHQIAYENLSAMKEEFECFKRSWFEFIRRMK